MQISGIGIIDIIIIVIYLVFIIWWGLRNGKSANAGSYFLAGRGTPWFIVGLSLFAASISSTTLIGQTGDAYATGIAVFNYNLTGVWVLVFFAVFLLPLYIRSGIFTIPEFLERRFDSRSRYYFSAISIIGNIFLDAAGALYSAALILKLLFPEVELWVFVVIFAVIAASYTIPGGLSAAINTDIIQAAVLLVGSLVMMVICYVKGGGAYFASLMENGDIAARLIRPLSDTSTPWLGLLVGMPVLGIYFWANNQTLVQRVLSAKSVNQGRIGVMLAGFPYPVHPLYFQYPRRDGAQLLPRYRESGHDLSHHGDPFHAGRSAGTAAGGHALGAHLHPKRHPQLRLHPLHHGLLCQGR